MSSFINQDEPIPIVDREALQSYFGSLDSVLLAYLFGSLARGQAGPLSDVDVAVLLADELDEEQQFETRLQIIGDLMDVLHTNEVDVAILNQTPLALAYRVLRDGILLYSRDEQIRITYTARIVNEYLDFEPILKRHEQAVLERARKGELLSGYNPHRGALARYRQRRQRLTGTSRTDV